MKNSKKPFIFGTVILLIFIVAISSQLSKNLQAEDILTDDFFNSDTILSIERINKLNFTEIVTSKVIQNEIQVLLKEVNLKRTDDSYSPIDADYRIISTSNQEDQLYLFVEENVIVFPHISSTGYKIKNNVDFMKTIDRFLY